MASSVKPAAGGKAGQYRANIDYTDIQKENIAACKVISDTIRTSLGPRGRDKLIIQSKGDILITNDGATILNQLQVAHPCAKMLVDVSKAQDIEVGDGTTTVVVLVGAFLNAVETLLNAKIHPMKISRAFMAASAKAAEILSGIGKPIDIHDKEKLIGAAITSLSSKVVSEYAQSLAPIAVHAVHAVYRKPTLETDQPMVDLGKIRIVKALGGTLDDSELINGMVLSQKASKLAGGPTKITNAKVGLIQFQLSPPKCDMENNVVVSDYQQIDRVIREERQYLAEICNKIKATGCNVLLIQKSVLRDAVCDTSLNFLAKMKIMVVRDIERADIEFICSSIGCQVVASIDNFKAEKLGCVDKVEEVSTAGGKIVKFTGLKTNSTAVSVVVRGSTQLIIDEAERSLHDALCVVRSLFKRQSIIAAGGAAEMEIAVKLMEYARTLGGIEGYCMEKYADAFEIIPYTLAENAGLNPVQITTDLRQAHREAGGEHHGIHVKKGAICDMLQQGIYQPTFISISSVCLATELVSSILRIDGMQIIADDRR